MSKLRFTNKKAKYGGLSLVLIALTVAVVVLLNTVFGTLVTKYEWYTVMNDYGNYDVSDTAKTVVSDILESANGYKVNIIFCNTEDELSDDDTGKYIYNTAKQLEEAFPQQITLTFYDIWTNPTNVKKYTQTKNIATGEYTESALKSTNVIVTCEGNNDYYRVYDETEFFVFEDNDSSSVWAYDGDQVFASAIARAVDPEEHIVCMTSNHGEVYYDYEFLYLLDDAGYTIYYQDLYADGIPENCHLVISYNPNIDLLDDELSEKSELELLRNFLSEGGNTFLVFMENGTPTLENYETLLSEWGISTRKSGDYRLMVEDANGTLTSDGCTIYGKTSTNAKATAFFGDFDDKVVFKDATALSYATEGYHSNKDGTYTSTDSTRTMFPLFTTDGSAQGWANGNVVAEGNMILGALTEETHTGGNSYVGVFASADMMTEDFLQSAVYGNSNLFKHLVGYLGKTNTTEGITIKPFQSLDISTVTTSEKLAWTLTLSLTPVVLLAGVCVYVMIRRKNA